MRWACGLCVLTLAVPLAAHAQSKDTIDTDGPDFVESTEVVGRGRWQFESGPYLQKDHRNGTSQRTVSTPLLLKFGTSEKFEARLETDGRIWDSGAARAEGLSDAQRGFGDIAIGFKWHAQDRDPNRGAPAIAWIAHADLPTGATNVRGLSIRPSLRSVIGWDLPDDFSLGLMPGIKLDTAADGHHYVSGILGFVLGKRWTERFRSFVESAAIQIATQKSGGVILYNNVGAAFLITNTWQIGVRAG